MKQITWIYIMLFGLAVSFAVVSVLIFFFGAQPTLVAKKLKIGSMIISFNFMLAGCYASKDMKDPITCYSSSTGGTDCSTDNGKSNTDDSDSAAVVSTDVECYGAPNESDTGTPIETEEPFSTDIECYDGPVESDTGTPIETEEPVDSDLACYDTDVESPTDTEQEPTTDTGMSPDSDITCYDMVEEPTESEQESESDTDSDSEPMLDAGTPPDSDVTCYDYVELPTDTEDGEQNAGSYEESGFESEDEK